MHTIQPSVAQGLAKPSLMPPKPALACLALPVFWLSMCCNGHICEHILKEQSRIPHPYTDRGSRHAEMPLSVLKQEDSSPCASFSQDMAQLQDPLWLYMLPRLSAQHITALRSTCHALRCMVDSTPRSVMEPVLGGLLAPSILKHAPPGANLQELLRQQHTFLQIARSLPACSAQRIVLSANAGSASISWAPRWPCDTLFIDFMYESSLWGRRLDGGPLLVFKSSLALPQDLPQGQPHEDLPTSPHVASWTCWCKDTRAFACQSSFNGRHDVAVVDAVSGKLRSKVRVSQGGPTPEMPPSPDGTLLLVHSALHAQFLNASVMGLVLPDLHFAYHLDPPLQPAAESSNAGGTSTPGDSSNAGEGSSARDSESAIRPAWCGCSTTNAHVAVAWHAPGASGHVLYALAIHAAADGQMIRRMDVSSHCGNGGLLSPQFNISWSPTGTCILVHAAEAWKRGRLLPHCLMDLQGQCRVLDIAELDLNGYDPALRSDATWSPCGHYLHVCDLVLSGLAFTCFSYLWDVAKSGRWLNGRQHDATPGRSSGRVPAAFASLRMSRWYMH